MPSSEALGIGFAIIILIVAFGSVLAMGLPIGVALAGIVSGTTIAGLLSHVVTMPDFTSTIGVMIGLGVGIDYALLITTRFRENLHPGHTVESSTLVAMATAGRAVLFAGTTVVISLLGMLIMQLSFVSGLAIGAAVVVAMTLLASLTLLPALLGFAGERVEVTRWRGLIVAGLIALALIGVGLGVPALIVVTLPVAVVVLLASFAFAPLRERVLVRERKPLRETLSYRWSRVIQHRPWSAVVVGVVVLVVLALPLLGLRLGFSDEGNLPEDTTTRQAYDLLAEGFGPGFNGTMILAAEVPSDFDQSTFQAVSDALAADPGVAVVSRSDHQRRGRPDRGVLEGHPDDRTAGRGHHRPRRPRARRGAPRRHRRAPASTSRWPAPSPSTPTSPTTCPSACRGSSPPCSACRSCC